MDAADVRERIAELAASRPDAGSDLGALLEVALFVEETFGIALTDDDICERLLGTHAAVGELVLARLGLADPCVESAE